MDLVRDLAGAARTRARTTVVENASTIVELDRGRVVDATATAGATGRGTVGFVMYVVVYLARTIWGQIAVAVGTMALGFAMGTTCARAKRSDGAKWMRKAMKKRMGRQATREVTWIEKKRAERGLGGEDEDEITFHEDFKETFSTHAPIWTKDSSYGRAHWLNRVIDGAWPYIDTGVSKTVKESVEPILRELLPTWVTWIGFEKFTLGPRAPTITGIRSHQSHMENSILDIELSWASDCDVVVTIYVFGVRFPVTVRGLQIKMLAQVTFDPLVDVIPCLGALEACLIEMPEILDFRLFIPGGVDLLALPFVHRTVLKIVRQSIGEMLLYPYKLHIPIMPASGIQAASTGMMRIRFLNGKAFYKRRNYSKLSRKRGKKNSRFTQMLKTDSYFIKYWTREQRQLSTPPRNGETPSWEGTADAFVLCDRDTPLYFRLLKEGADRISNYGEIQIMCGEIADRGGGKVVIELPFIEPSFYKEECPLEYLAAADGYSYEEIMGRWAEITAWHAKADAGAVQARTKYFYRCLEEMDRRKRVMSKYRHPTLALELEYIDTGAPDELDGGDEKYELGVLTVEVKEADNLLRVDSQLPNPMATLRCAKQEYRTQRILKSSHPKWNERYVFYNVVAEIDPLEIEITGFEKSLGRVVIDTTLVRLNGFISDRFKLQDVSKGEVLLELSYTPMAATKTIARP